MGAGRVEGKGKEKTPPVRKHQASNESELARTYLDRGLAMDGPKAGATITSHRAVLPTAA